MAADKKNLEAKWSEYLEQQKKANVKYMLLSAAGILTVLIIWQGVVMLGLVDSHLLPGQPSGGFVRILRGDHHRRSPGASDGMVDLCGPFYPADL